GDRGVGDAAAFDEFPAAPAGGGKRDGQSERERGDRENTACVAHDFDSVASWRSFPIRDTCPATWSPSARTCACRRCARRIGGGFFPGRTTACCCRGSRRAAARCCCSMSCTPGA